MIYQYFLLKAFALACFQLCFKRPAVFFSFTIGLIDEKAGQKIEFESDSRFL